MIISKLQGGLGNQMFQYAYGRHLSNKYNSKLYLDDKFYKRFHGYPIRTFLLDKFPNTEIDISIDMFSTNLPFKTIVDNFNFNQILPSDKYNYYLDGYWQSEKYFIESEDVIRNDFRLPKPNIPEVYQNSLSIHVRRGDYVTSNGYHPVQPIEYYKSAIDIIGDYDHLFIFSDDIRWCKENLKFKNMIFCQGNSETEDLSIMSNCKNNIIVNSSFSWWGAWLNENPKKKIIAPKQWFGETANLNESDIIPEKWIKI